MACGTLGASADNAKIRIREETTYGAAVTGLPKFDGLRFSSESLKQTTATQIPDEITGDRNTPDIVRSSVQGDGDIAFALSYQSLGSTDKGMDILWKSAFQATGWTTRVALTATTITFESNATATEPNPVIKRSSGSFITDGFLVNRVVAVQGSSQPTNNAFVRLVTVTALVMEVKPLNTAADFVDDLTAGESITLVMGQQITNAQTCRSYNIEIELTDLVNVFKRMLGAVPSTFNLAVPLDGSLTGSIGMLCAKETSGAATLGDGSPTLPEATDIMSSIDNVLIFTENLAEFDILSFSVNGNNNLRGRRNVGDAALVSVGSGRLEATGALTAFFANTTFYDKYLNFTQTGFMSVFRDNATNAYVLDLPAVKLTTGQRVVSGPNTDVINDMGFGVKKHAIDGFMVRLTRFDAADTP
jgi:hypothetical protein